jgi:hypothetical protein
MSATFLESSFLIINIDSYLVVCGFCARKNNPEGSSFSLAAGGAARQGRVLAA